MNGSLPLEVYENLDSIFDRAEFVDGMPVPQINEAVREIFNSEQTLNPSLLNSLCGFTYITMYKSPLEPPFLPASPSLATLIFALLSTPAGIFTFIVFSVSTLPSPLHFLQGELII